MLCWQQSCASMGCAYAPAQFPAIMLSCMPTRTGFPGLFLRFQCSCANYFLHVWYSHFALPQSAVLTHSQQVCQREVARLQVHHKVQNVPSSLPSHMPRGSPLLSHRGTSSTFPFFPKAENPSVRQSSPSVTATSPVMCCQHFNKGLLYTQLPPPRVCSTAHVPGWDARRLETCGAGGLCAFGFSISTKCFPITEERGSSTWQTRFCYVPPTRNSQTWVWEIKIPIYLVERVAECSPGKNIRDEDGKEGFGSLSGTTGTVSASSKLRRGPYLERRKQCQVSLPAQCWLRTELCEQDC